MNKIFVNSCKHFLNVYEFIFFLEQMPRSLINGSNAKYMFSFEKQTK